MIYNFKSIRKQILGLALQEVSFKRRGFRQGGKAEARLELVAGTVVNGYNAAVENGSGEDLKMITSSIKEELVGFFHEGIAMGLYTLSIFSLFGNNCFWDFVKGPGRKHEYMSYIGAGLAIGVFNRPFKKFLDKACPMSGSLVIDGIGFYYAMFKTRKTLSKFFVPKSIRNNSFFQERYDNGIGRAVWFYDSGEADRIAYTISKFPVERRPAIWSGVGLAASYAGGVDEEKIKLLRTLAGEHATMLAQGAVLAAHTRYTAGNPKRSDMVERTLVGRSAKECHLFAEKAKQALAGRRYIDDRPSFQVFLENVRNWIESTPLSNGVLDRKEVLSA